MDRFEEIFWSGQSLEELYRNLQSRPNTGLAAVFVAAMREWKRSFEGTGRSVASLSQRIDKVLDVTIQREVERLEGKLLVLASIGSAGALIGLFGTVWGIMSSFTSIAASKSTSLAVVAPGIAEALFATAIGLFAAIPAVIAYNKLAVAGDEAAVAARGLRRRVLGDPVAPDRRAHARARGAGGLRRRAAMTIASAMAHGHGGGRRRRRRGKRGVINEINMTPFIDVMLVLLIIFMVTAPLMTAGVPIDLPKAAAAPLNTDKKPVTLSIKADGKVYLGETALADDGSSPA